MKPAEHIQRLIDKVPGSQWMKEHSKRWIIPGFEKVSIYHVVKFFASELGREELFMRAKASAFTFFLALFPAMLFFVALVPYIPVDNLSEKILDVLQEVMPSTLSTLIAKTLTDILNQPTGGTLSVGLIMALIIASNGMVSMMSSFDQSIREKDNFIKRSLFKKRLIAVGLMLVLFFLLIFSVGLIIIGNQVLVDILATLEIRSFIGILLFTTLKFIIIFMLFFSSISLIYYFGPSLRQEYNLFSPGSTFATLLSIILSMAFSFFINNITHPGRFFGSIGAIIVLQVWIYLNSLALLLGFELNNRLEELRKTLNPPEEVPETPSAEQLAIDSQAD